MNICTLKFTNYSDGLTLSVLQAAVINGQFVISANKESLVIVTNGTILVTFKYSSTTGFENRKNITIVHL